MDEELKNRNGFGRLSLFWRFEKCHFTENALISNYLSILCDNKNERNTERN